MTIVLNEPPYGNEKAWNALRLAKALVSSTIKIKVKIFLFGDAVALAKRGQRTPEGYYNLEDSVRELVKEAVEFMACGVCASARGLTQVELIEGVEIGSTMLLAHWIKESQGILTF